MWSFVNWITVFYDVMENTAEFVDKICLAFLSPKSRDIVLRFSVLTKEWIDFVPSAHRALQNRIIVSHSVAPSLLYPTIRRPTRVTRAVHCIRRDDEFYIIQIISPPRIYSADLCGEYALMIPVITDHFNRPRSSAGQILELKCCYL